jgi:hypothetical protein
MDFWAIVIHFQVFAFLHLNYCYELSANSKSHTLLFDDKGRGKCLAKNSNIELHMNERRKEKGKKEIYVM